MAAAVALDLVQREEVREQWLMPSVLPKMSVGALACHLGRQVVRAVELLPMATDVPPLESADANYHRAAWVRSTSPDDPSNDRSTDDAEAAFGAGPSPTGPPRRWRRCAACSRPARRVMSCRFPGRAGPCAGTTSCSPGCWRSWSMPMIS